MKNEKAEAVLAAIESSITQLAEETDEFRQSAKWKSILTMMSAFHSYSFTNQMMILMQRPDARRVAGFQTWKQVGRNVVKGAKGIAILAPIMVKDKSKPAATDQLVTVEGAAMAVKKHLWFRTVYVFDYADTEGKPLDVLSLADVHDDNGKLETVEAAVRYLGINVEYGFVPLIGAKGASIGNKKIIVREDLAAGEKCAVLIHETAHELAHWQQGITPSGSTRKREEIEAESTAYAVMRYLGIESTANIYLTTYNADGEAIKKSLGRIRETVAKVITAIEAVSMGKKDVEPDAEFPLPAAA